MGERDKQYDLYYENVKSTWGLKDIHIAQGYMRGSDPSWPSQGPEDEKHHEGMTDIVLVFGDATLTGAAKPERIKDMIVEWEHQIAEKAPEDPRIFTRTVIAQHMVLNRHREEDAGRLLLCGAVWLMSTHKQVGTRTLGLMQRGDVEFRYDITEDAQDRTRRFRLSEIDFRLHDSV